MFLHIIVWKCGRIVYLLCSAPWNLGTIEETMWKKKEEIQGSNSDLLHRSQMWRSHWTNFRLNFRWETLGKSKFKYLKRNSCGRVAEWSLPTPEDPGSNPIICNLNRIIIICFGKLYIYFKYLPKQPNKNKAILFWKAKCRDKNHFWSKKLTANHWGVNHLFSTVRIQKAFLLKLQHQRTYILDILTQKALDFCKCVIA